MVDFEPFLVGERDDRQRTCTVCDGVLVSFFDGSRVFWQHFDDGMRNHPDHDPVVHVGPIRRYCDFCGPFTPACWSYQVIPVTPGGPTTLRITSRPGPDAYTDDSAAGRAENNDTPWYACGECADLIEGRQWRALLIRCVRTLSEQSGHKVSTEERLHLHTVHQQFAGGCNGSRLAIAWDR